MSKRTMRLMCLLLAGVMIFGLAASIIGALAGV